MIRVKVRKKVCNHTNCGGECWVCKLPPADGKGVIMVSVENILPTEETGHGKGFSYGSPEFEKRIEEKMALYKEGNCPPIEVADKKPTRTWPQKGKGISVADAQSAPEPFYYVVNGHHRLEAAKRLGLKKVAVTISELEA